MKQVLGGVFSFVLLAVVVLLMAGTGVGMIGAGSGERQMTEAPEVPLAELAAHAGRTVRVRGTVAGQPALQAAGGEALAFQAVTITHEESSGVGEDRTEETVTDYARLAPQVLVVSDGAAAAGIVPQGIDLRFVPETFSGQTGRAGELPAAAASLLPAGVFTELPDRSGADLSVRAIREGAAVTVHGTVDVVDGQAVLRAPADAPFVVSPRPWDEVVSEAGTSGIINLVFGWGLLLGAVAATFFLLRGWR
ncbi:MAG TPA: hypothetical protein VHG51_12910, partial [Longimicrobiaceae bacterium]|nr:hypothetical protein [Longimicrobiaceae bacterium]